MMSLEKYEQVLKSSEHDSWLKAMKSEMDSMSEKQSIDFVRWSWKGKTNWVQMDFHEEDTLGR